MASICTTAIAIIATVPTAIGSGAIGAQAASTSEAALDSSSPVGWRWCQRIGSSRYCRVTSRRSWDCIRYCITPAPQRRATMLTPRTIATPMKSATAVTSAPSGATPSSKAGSTTLSVAQPSTQASATVSAPKSSAPTVEMVNTHGSRRMATPSTSKPRRRVARSWAACAGLEGATGLPAGGRSEGRHDRDATGRRSVQHRRAPGCSRLLPRLRP